MYYYNLSVLCHYWLGRRNLCKSTKSVWLNKTKVLAVVSLTIHIWQSHVRQWSSAAGIWSNRPWVMEQLWQATYANLDKAAITIAIRLRFDCDVAIKIAIPLRFDYDEKWTCSFFVTSRGIVANKVAIAIAIAIWIRFDYNLTTTIAIKITIQLRFDFDSTHQSGHHDSMLMKAWIHTRRHFTSGVCENRRMLPDVHPSAWTPFLLPWRTLLRHYMPLPLPSYWLRRLSTRRKNENVRFSS